MKILVEAKDQVKFIDRRDFEELTTVLGKINTKYKIEIEIKNFMTKDI